MKFERLTPPGWQLPDLVAFNEKVQAETARITRMNRELSDLLGRLTV